MSNATAVFPDLSLVSSGFKGILLDAYGVFWGGNDVGPLPGSQAMMKRLVTSGHVVGILSNSTQMAAKEVLKLQSRGIEKGTHFHFLVTSGEVAQSVFLRGEIVGRKYFLFGGIDPKLSSHHAIFQNSTYTETLDIGNADFIYVTVPQLQGQDQTDPELFREEVKKIKASNLPMVCANPDLFATEGNPPRPVVRQGGIAKLYEELGGRVIYIGKPYSAAYQMAMSYFQGQKPGNVLMVGDTPETDIRGARSIGMGTALTTKTGVMSERIAKHGLAQAIQALPEGDTPDFYIEQLGSP